MNFDVPLNSARYNRGGKPGQPKTVTGWDSTTSTFKFKPAKAKDETNKPRGAIASQDLAAYETSKKFASDRIQGAMAQSPAYR
jgi:hypothetical protein